MATGRSIGPRGRGCHGNGKKPRPPSTRLVEAMESEEPQEPPQPLDSPNPATSEESKEPKKLADWNPLLKPALTGDVEGLQKIFEDAEEPHQGEAMQLLLEQDVAGRDLLYAACMAGQSEVIRALAKYGVNLNEKTARGYSLLHCAAAWGRLETLKTLVDLDIDIEAVNFQGENAQAVAARYSQVECVEFLKWADAKLTLKRNIAKIQATMADTEKVQGKLNKEDKNTALNACRAKADWLETHKESSIQEVLEQKQHLDDIMQPIFLKIFAPRPVKSARSVVN
ncbi:ankyrin repeat domain-containing protein 45 isoform X2 [Tachyglossus aculeatus]|uniref:ankyrin repeat domain-containing protein 45 isoform X2 n=1 Tax=Tachyglossus aculeatus TaxID=9261 RepID=UPI0018F5D6D2|nr:ankyrin repeat domain-containing protein 45 isoform X2 [Tachyglossus aculeatus]